MIRKDSVRSRNKLGFQLGQSVQVMDGANISYPAGTMLPREVDTT